jgi:hypothetical protein
MDLERKEKRAPIELEEFICKLQLGKATQIGWKNIMLRVMKQRKTGDRVRGVIAESTVKLEK